MNLRLAIIGVVVVLAAIVGYNSMFTVSETQQALVLQFGQHRQTIQNDPGLHFKAPFIQDVVYYESRVLDVDPPVEQVILTDQRRLDVDSFARYRISDPLRFYQTVRDEVVARQRISTFVNASLRSVLGNVTQLEVLSEERGNIMNEIRDRVIGSTAPLGIEIIDVRIGRADVPDDTVQSVYDRMRSERQREAAEFRAQGEEQSQQIRARADRERSVLLAEAERDAQILRGEGDAVAIEVQAEAFTQDAEFFALYRTLQAYRVSMSDSDTTLVLSPQGDFFRYFGDITGGRGEAAFPAPMTPQEIQQLLEPVREVIEDVPPSSTETPAVLPPVDMNPSEAAPDEGQEAAPGDPPAEEDGEDDQAAFPTPGGTGTDAGTDATNE